MSFFPELDFARPMLPLNKQGAVYTPHSLSQWAAELLFTYLPIRSPARLLDPACGDGALLCAVAAKSKKLMPLMGIDIDETALTAAAQRLPDLVTHHQNSLLLMDAGHRKTLLGDVQHDASLTNPPGEPIPA